MSSTIAHELMHVWLFHRDFPLDDAPWVEGSCSYAAYLCVRDDESKDAAFQRHLFEADPDSIYGGGFRRVKRYVDVHGVEAWLDALAAPAGDSARGR